MQERSDLFPSMRWSSRLCSWGPCTWLLDSVSFSVVLVSCLAAANAAHLGQDPWGRIPWVGDDDQELGAHLLLSNIAYPPFVLFLLLCLLTLVCTRLVTVTTLPISCFRLSSLSSLCQSDPSKMSAVPSPVAERALEPPSRGRRECER